MSGFLIVPGVQLIYTMKRRSTFCSIVIESDLACSCRAHNLRSAAIDSDLLQLLPPSFLRENITGLWDTRAQ